MGQGQHLRKISCSLVSFRVRLRKENTRKDRWFVWHTDGNTETVMIKPVPHPVGGGYNDLLALHFNLCFGNYKDYLHVIYNNYYDCQNSYIM